MILGDPIILGGGGGVPCTLSVNTAAYATVTATLGDKTITAAANSSGAATLELDEVGIWTVTATNGSETKTTTVDTTLNMSGNLVFVDTVLENNDWETISKAAKSGQASQLWKVGDTKKVTIGSSTYTAQIVDFDSYDVADSASYGRTKSGITFQLTETENTYRTMNSSQTISGGWASTSIRSYCDSTLLNSIESNLKNVLVSVRVPYTAGKVTTISTVEEKIFLPSLYEVDGTASSSKYYAAEGSHFDFYAAGNSRIKKSNGTSTTRWWWLRSVFNTSGTYFGVVNASGAVTYVSPTSSYYISPVFCV